GHQGPPWGPQAWLSPLWGGARPPLAAFPGRAVTIPPPAPALPLSPVLRSCSVPVPSHLSPVQAWVESLRHPEDTLRGLTDLHPDVFAVTPRLDILHTVATWQRNYKRISHASVRSRAEVRGGGRKPWRQKGSGRARHGSIRSPLWRGGGIAHGPRGPTSYFYMVPMRVRVLALKVALTVKLMQDDLHVVDTLEVPTSDPRYLLELARVRRWGQSVLMVDVNEFPENISAAAEGLKSITLIPALGETRTTWGHFGDTRDVLGWGIRGDSLGTVGKGWGRQGQRGWGVHGAGDTLGTARKGWGQSGDGLGTAGTIWGGRDSGQGVVRGAGGTQGTAGRDRPCPLMSPSCPLRAQRAQPAEAPDAGADPGRRHLPGAAAAVARPALLGPLSLLAALQGPPAAPPGRLRPPPGAIGTPIWDGDPRLGFDTLPVGQDAAPVPWGRGLGSLWSLGWCPLSVPYRDLLEPPRAG
uniref:Large ribosomal subunit protein uL4m n=1 Tax=Corvus moneduloides TaxID=1196302 RepID=A0A8U7P294_CORMO